MLNIIFVIGGPGVGKGTQCSLLVKEWPTKVFHIGLGDVLREEEAKPDSRWRAVLQRNLKEGLIGSKEMVVDLLQEKLEGLSAHDKQKIILLDGHHILQGVTDERLTDVQASLGPSTGVTFSRNKPANQLAVLC